MGFGGRGEEQQGAEEEKEDMTEEEVISDKEESDNVTDARAGAGGGIVEAGEGADGSDGFAVVVPVLEARQRAPGGAGVPATFEVGDAGGVAGEASVVQDSLPARVLSAGVEDMVEAFDDHQEEGARQGEAASPGGQGGEGFDIGAFGDAAEEEGAVVLPGQMLMPVAVDDQRGAREALPNVIGEGLSKILGWGDGGGGHVIGEDLGGSYGEEVFAQAVVPAAHPAREEVGRGGGLGDELPFEWRLLNVATGEDAQQGWGVEGYLERQKGRLYRLEELKRKLEVGAVFNKYSVEMESQV